jgi:2-polyprenyl-3-methyl-5-hydroxy-6-metoxy-1,4-benzoquinol methylase
MDRWKLRKLQTLPVPTEILKLIRAMKSSGRLLDVGCAYGMLVNLASEHFEAYGIGISRFAVEKSKRYSRGNIAKASAITLLSEMKHSTQ